MRVAFWTFSTAVGAVIGYGYPFVAVLQRRSLLRTVLWSWLFLFAFVLMLSLVLPGIVSLFSPRAARELLTSWVPESQAFLLCW
jgi:hypothetical protein